MALILKNNYVYLHIPKTGGNWLTRILHELNLVRGAVSHKHADLSFLESFRSTRAPNKYLKEMWLRSRFMVRPITPLCVVRHPTSWYESWYRYQVGRSWPSWPHGPDKSTWHICQELNHLCTNPPRVYNEYLERVIRYSPGFCSRLYGRYTGGTNTVVFHLEKLREEAIAFFSERQWGLTHDLIGHFHQPPFGTSPELDTHADSHLLEELMFYDASALRLYGYEERSTANLAD
jgi:hypothetical protein